MASIGGRRCGGALSTARPGSPASDAVCLPLPPVGGEGRGEGGLSYPPPSRIARSTRSGFMGSWRSRTPTAS
ncbi:hypothetical protein JCM30394_02580 [Deferrisoma palaeochoriense]